MTDLHLPIDNDARERIRHSLNSTLFVTAGAGSGKTRELVSRISSLVRSGVPLQKIAAITFTNAAAAELRDRVRGELESLVENPGGITPAEVETIELALASIDSAAIQTLHSFAQRLISLFPLETGLPPELELRDEVGASIAFEDHWQPFLEQLLEDGCGRPDVAAALLHGNNTGITTKHMRDIAGAFHEHWDRVLGAEFPCPPMPDLDPRAVIAAMEEAEALVGEILPGHEADDKAYEPLLRLVRPLAALRASWESLEHATTDAERLAAQERVFWLLKPKPPTITWGRKNNWRGNALHRIRELSREAIAAREQVLGGIREACLGPILAAIQQFIRDYRDERMALGTLEFHDVLILARDLLAANLGVRARLHARYDAILIDEFQDTDPLQVEIAVLLAADPRTPSDMPWNRMPIPPGHLFFVGDPKQSIYRFRGADIDLYTAAAERFGRPETGETVLLTQNFRSAPSLIAWVNHVFGSLFTLDREHPGANLDASQVPFDALSAWREETVPGGTAVRLIGGPVAKLDSEKANRRGRADRRAQIGQPRLRAIESADIAALIDGIRDDALEWQIKDGDQLRPARLADIAILLPTRVALPAIEQALSERGIPSRIESRSLLFETQEVRDLLGILAAVDDPTDQVAVVGALRSPGFGCSDADIYCFAAAGGTWNYLRDTPPDYPANDLVSLGIAALRDLHERRWWLSIGEMVDTVIRERRLLQVAFAARRPRETWQRLRFVHDQARAFTSAGGRSLRQFVRFMERQADEQARVNERAVTDEDDDAVRIMTIHASKGLEFPIVILAGLNSRVPRFKPVLLYGPGGQPEVHVGNQDVPFETPGYASLLEREDAMERLEDDRLLYVGATRARDHLVVSVYHLRTLDPKAEFEPHESRHISSECTAAECLLAISEERPELWRRMVVEPREPAAPVPPPVLRIDTPGDYETWRQERHELIESLSRAPVVAATALAKAANQQEEKPEQMDEAAPWRKGRAATSLGRAVHAVLQTIDLATGEGIVEVSRAQAIAEGLPARADEIASLVETARQSAAVQAAVSSGRFWREVYVATEIDGVTVEGFIDLLYEGPKGFVVVDYKTDSAGDSAAIDAAMTRYRMQGAAYSLALQESLGRPVSACTFVFIRPAEQRDIPDLAAAMVEVRALIPLAVRPSAPAENSAGSGDGGEPGEDAPPGELSPQPGIVAPRKGMQLALDLG